MSEPLTTTTPPAAETWLPSEIAIINNTVKTDAPIVVSKLTTLATSVRAWGNRHPNALHSIVFFVLGLILGSLIH